MYGREKETPYFLEQVELRNIHYATNLLEFELNTKNTSLQKREAVFIKIIELISENLSNDHPLNPSTIKLMTELVSAHKEEDKI